MMKLIFLMYLYQVTSFENFIQVQVNGINCREIKCDDIREVFIPENVDICTNELPLYIDLKKQKLVFLDNLDFIKSKGEFTECINAPDYFNLNSLKIKRLNKHASTEKEKERYSTTHEIESSTYSSRVIIYSTAITVVRSQVEINENYLENYYINYEDHNTLVKMIRDLIFLIFLIILHVLILSPKSLGY
jgi:hypothetical protein